MYSSRRPPKYRHYKPKDLGVVRLDGRDHYLGKFDSPESWEKYHRLVAEWHAAQGRPLPARDSEATASVPSVNQVLLAYWKFAEGYYVRDGETTKELTCMREALRPLRRLYGSLPAPEFGPAKLKVVRDYMIDEQDLCRTEINKRIGRIKRFFRWAVSEEIVPPSLAHGLDSVKGLMMGRSRARESQRVKPVPDQHVDATLPFLPPPLVAMIECQRNTGMRPGEVVLMRKCDIDMSGDVWIFFPDRHKNDWRNHPRAVAIGPKGQAILKPFLDRRDDAYLFSPAESYAWRLANRQNLSGKQRKTPIYPSEIQAREKAKRKRRARRAGKRVRLRYTTESYWKALYYTFNTAEKRGIKMDRWFPNQLRHSRGTELRKKFGVEASRVSLGHARLEATEIYAEKDLMLAIEIAREAG